MKCRTKEYCDYQLDPGHRTEDYLALKNFSMKIVGEGHLNEFIVQCTRWLNNSHTVNNDRPLGATFVASHIGFKNYHIYP